MLDGCCPGGARRRHAEAQRARSWGRRKIKPVGVVAAVVMALDVGLRFRGKAISHIGAGLVGVQASWMGIGKHVEKIVVLLALTMGIEEEKQR